MNLKIDYQASEAGYVLAADLEINLESDAEALGCAAAMTNAVAHHLSMLAKTAHPRFEARIRRGMNKALAEASGEENPYWPFTNWLQEDATKEKPE